MDGAREPRISAYRQGRPSRLCFPSPIFSCGDAALRRSAAGCRVFEIGFFSTVFSCVALPFVRQPHERWRDMFRMHRPGLVLLRAVAGRARWALQVFAFTHLPLAEVYSLFFLSPLLVTILSIPILGESVGWRRGLAIVVGFAGVLLVVRPGFRELHAGASGGPRHCASAASVYGAGAPRDSARPRSGSR